MLPQIINVKVNEKVVVMQLDIRQLKDGYWLITYSSDKEHYTLKTVLSSNKWYAISEMQSYIDEKGLNEKDVFNFVDIYV